MVDNKLLEKYKTILAEIETWKILNWMIYEFMIITI